MSNNTFPSPAPSSIPSFDAQLDAMSGALRKLLPSPAVVRGMAWQANEREMLLDQLPHLATEALNAFVAEVFTSDELVTAYRMPLRHAQEPGRPAPTPLELCLRGMHRAYHYPYLAPWERELAAVAVLVQPCGYFWCLRKELVRGEKPQSTRSLLKDILNMRNALLEDALRQLRRAEPLIGRTLGHLLGMDEDYDTDPQQLARISEAMRVGGFRQV